MRLALIALLAIAAAACSRSETANVQRDLNTTGADLRQTASDAAVATQSAAAVADERARRAAEDLRGGPSNSQ
jgi:hypothetical protein